MIKYIFIAYFIFLSLFAYNRKEYGHWKDYDKDGFNTRHEILLKYSLVEPVIKTSKNGNKRVVRGKWKTQYSGEYITKARLIDIDHLVAVKEIDDLCGDKLSHEKKELFYNDEENLVISSQRENRKKGAKDESQYLPPKMDKIEYRNRRAYIKKKWCGFI